jgi:hypothetical protein
MSMNTTRIVVLDGFTANPGDLDWGPLAALGNLTVHERTAAGEVVAHAARGVGSAGIAAAADRRGRREPGRISGRPPGSRRRGELIGQRGASRP